MNIWDNIVLHTIFIMFVEILDADELILEINFNINMDRFDNHVSRLWLCSPSQQGYSSRAHQLSLKLQQAHFQASHHITLSLLAPCSHQWNALCSVHGTTRHVRTPLSSGNMPFMGKNELWILGWFKVLFSGSVILLPQHSYRRVAG